MATPISHWGVATPVAFVPTNLPQVSDDFIVSSTCLVGIEVEVENAVGMVRSINPVWSTEADGSLRNNGIEFISRIIQAKDAPAAIHNLMNETLTDACCFSPRTSIHVHLDMSDKELGTSIDLALLYTCFEPLFYRFVGRGRMNNIYCVPIFKTRLIDQLAKNRADGKISRWTKYTGLNLLPLTKQGTVEFRHMHGTFDVRKVALWIRLITKLRDYVVATDSKSLRGMVLEFDETSDYRSLLFKIFDRDVEFLKYRGFSDIAASIDATKQAFASGSAASSEKFASSFEAPFFKFPKQK